MVQHLFHVYYLYKTGVGLFDVLCEIFVWFLSTLWLKKKKKGILVCPQVDCQNKLVGQIFLYWFFFVCLFVCLFLKTWKGKIAIRYSYMGMAKNRSSSVESRYFFHLCVTMVRPITLVHVLFYLFVYFCLFVLFCFYFWEILYNIQYWYAEMLLFRIFPDFGIFSVLVFPVMVFNPNAKCLQVFCFCFFILFWVFCFFRVFEW